MMRFRVVQQALLDTMGAAAKGRFRVTGYRGEGHDAKEVQNSKKLVQAYYSSGDFPKGKGGRLSPQHLMVFNLDFSVSASAKANLAVLQNPEATVAQVQAALVASTDAAFEADILLDEIFEFTYQILMDGRNIDLGLKKGTMSSRWIDRMVKGAPQPHGSLVVLTGQAQYSCQVAEDLTGDEGIPVSNGAISTKIDFPDDDVEETYAG